MKSLTTSLSGPFLAALIAVSGCDQSAPPAPPAATSDVSVAQPDVQGPSAPADTADSTPSANDALTPHPEAGAIEGLTRDALAAWKLADLDALMRLSPNGTPPIARDGTRFVAMFGPDSWRAKVVAQWNGSVASVRVAGPRALAHFAELADGRLALADFKLELGAWRFVGIVPTARTTFEAFGSVNLAP